MRCSGSRPWLTSLMPYDAHMPASSAFSVLSCIPQAWFITWSIDGCLRPCRREWSIIRNKVGMVDGYGMWRCGSGGIAKTLDNEKPSPFQVRVHVVAPSGIDPLT